MLGKTFKGMTDERPAGRPRISWRGKCGGSHTV